MKKRVKQAANANGGDKKMSVDEIFKQLRAQYKFLKDNPDCIGTTWIKLGRYFDNRWAIVLSWFDYDGDGKLGIYGKVAYQSINNIMQCDYDVDWTMPYDEETGEVDDTEVLIGGDEYLVWLINQWERIEAGLIRAEMEKGL